MPESENRVRRSSDALPALFPEQGLVTTEIGSRTRLNTITLQGVLL
jgi:hypothetical protein